MKAHREQDQRAVDAEVATKPWITVGEMGLLWHVPPWLIAECTWRDRLLWRFRWFVWLWWKVRK